MIRVDLDRAYFTRAEVPLVHAGALTASLFSFPSGVAAVRLSGPRVDLVMLPYQGQQIWSAVIDGRARTMVSMFDGPRPTQTYLETYGGFLLHCGVTAMGVPGPGDTHPLHGELPNAPYQSAFIETGEDERGHYIGLGGLYRHIVAFQCRYRAEPLVKIYEQSGLIDVGLSITNEKRSPMGLMYLAHANFRPVDGGRLAYSAVYDAAHIRVRTSIPSHISPAPAYRDLLAKLAADPTYHHDLRASDAYDPEAVFFIDYAADTEGWGHTLQIHPDGRSDYLAHRPDQARRIVRWLSRTGDQDAIGIAFPSTSGVEGLAAETARGEVLSLAGGATWRIDMRLGGLDAAETAAVAARIEALMGRG